MEIFLKFIFVVALIGGIGYIGCVKCTKINGADIAESRCSPVLSNGDRNPHYTNSWNSCQARCNHDGKYASLDTKNCDCSCN